MDQIVARQLASDTQLASLELTLESNELLGACDPGYSCAYVSTICWRDPTTPLPMENNPRAVFERLFGASNSTDLRARSAEFARDRSILDSVAQGVARLQRGLGVRDRAKLSQYLEAVRDVERRIQRAEEQGSRDLPVVEQPQGIPATFEEHAALVFDLLGLAYQCDLTRVFTFMVAPGTKQSGVSAVRCLRSAPRDIAPPERSREDRETDQDQRPSHENLCVVRGEAAVDAGRGWVFAGSRHAGIRRRHQRR